MIREEALQTRGKRKYCQGCTRQELSNGKNEWTKVGGEIKKKKEPWGEERGGGDCLYSNLTRCHFFTYMGLSIPRG